MDKGTIGIIALSVVILAGIVGVAFQGEKNFTPRSECVEHSQTLGMHIHPNVKIIINGQTQPIPANIGISSTCMMAIHTHDDSGKVHIEYPEVRDFQIGDFFANWEQPFSKNQILDKKSDATHTITMTVDGKPSNEFEKLTMKDGQQIVIEYAEKK